MRKSLLLLVAAGALVAMVASGVAVGAGNNKPVKVIVGDLEVEGNGIFTPSVVSKTEFTPIALTVSGAIRKIGGGHPPALKELIVETDKNGSVDVKGYPICPPGKIQSTNTKAAKAACGPAIIGKGKTEVGIFFDDQGKEIPVTSDLLMFNGGVKGGVTTLLVHAYITVPVPAAIVTTVKIKKIKNGRYGLLSVASIPKIAGGSGSVKSFSLKIDKKFTYKGKKHSVLNLKCPDGKIQIRAEAIFAEGPKASLEFVRPCTGKN
jgi:hypothetical protein